MAGIHPMAVHLPIALVFVWPLLDVAGLALGRKDVSLAGVALLALAIPASLFATVTGQAAYDTAIAAGFAPEVLDTHADGGDLVPWLLLLLGIARLLLPRKLAKAGHLVAIALGFALAVFVYQVGRSGGVLVFEHGAGVAGRGASGVPPP